MLEEQEYKTEPESNDETSPEEVQLRATQDEVAKIAKEQLRVSRQYKMPRMTDIKKSEDLYNGIADKQIRNPFSDCYPFMSGYVDYLMSKIDDAPFINYSHQSLADYKKAEKHNALLRSQMKSKLPFANWDLKDRWNKKMAVFSGVGVFKVYGSSDGGFRFNIETVDYYDFHCEPGGGGDLENHLFLGQEGIFKTKEELKAGSESGVYDKKNVDELCTIASPDVYKENQDEYNQRLNRHNGLGLDPQTNNYVGQEVFKLVEWGLTYKGERWYVLFDDRSDKWVRCIKLKDMFSVVKPMSDALWPWVSWHTNEDPRVFWSKGPADDARPIAVNINRLINQEMYNRERRNYGVRGYDPTMFKDVASLADWRPDGLIPVDTKNGTRQIAQGVYEFKVGELGGTINLVEFLDSYVGQKTASTPGAQGNAETNKKVGVFFGELKQVEDRLGLYNKSYKDCYAAIGIRFRVALKDHLTDDVAVQLIGRDGIEWSSITKDDVETVQDFDIVVEGGDDGEVKRQEEYKLKLEGLKMVSTVNPLWKDREILKAVGFEEAELKEAFSVVDPGLRTLLSEADQACQDILNGETPELNRGANAAFMQYIVDFATDLTMEDKTEENIIAIRLNNYARQHTAIAAQNEARSVIEMINRSKIEQGLTPQGQGNPPQAPVPRGQGGGDTSPNRELPNGADFMNNPQGSAISVGQRMSNEVQ